MGVSVSGDGETSGGKCCSFLLISPDFTSEHAPQDERSNCSFPLIRCSFPVITARNRPFLLTPAGGVAAALRSIAALMGNSVRGRGALAKEADVTNPGINMDGQDGSRQHFLRGRRRGTQSDVPLSSSQSKGIPKQPLSCSLNHVLNTRVSRSLKRLCPIDALLGKRFFKKSSLGCKGWASLPQ